MTVPWLRKSLSPASLQTIKNRQKSHWHPGESDGYLSKVIYWMGFGNVLWFSCHQHITMETIKISNFPYYNKTPILRRSLQFIALLSKLTDFKLLSANRSYLFSSKQTIITLSKSSKKLLGFNDRNRSIITIYLTWANLQNLCSERMKIVAI